MKEKNDYNKLRGGYYTPKVIADFLCQWAIQSIDETILEPSCGDGVFLKSAAAILLQLGAKKENISELLLGIEYDKDEAKKAVNNLDQMGIPDPGNIVRSEDFFSFSVRELFGEPLGHTFSRKTFDVIIGNPPFIRYQDFPKNHKTKAFALMKQVGFNPNGLTNAWVTFLTVSAMLLTKNGRLAMVVPAELFQVNYAAETREFLSNFFEKITIITFRKLQFGRIQQEVVLLLAEKSSSKGIRVVELNNADELQYYNHERISSEVKPLDHTQDKWTQYFLEKDEILLLRRLKNDRRILSAKDFMEVDVGVVTGRNDFFILTKEEQEKWALENYARKIVGRSNTLKGIIFTEKDWKEMYKKNLPSLLFYPPDKSFFSLRNPVKEYIREGEKNKYHNGYKCSIRKRWYIVPSVWTPDAFVLRQIHDYPKIILNHTDATCTDTIHRARLSKRSEGKRIAVSFLNSLTLAFSEVTGRSYGGGVLTFEPTEIEALPLPLDYSDELDIDCLDGFIRKKDIESVLDMTDQILLVDGLGLSLFEVRKLRKMWIKLRDRRIQRKH